MKRSLPSLLLFLALSIPFESGYCQEWKTMMLRADSLCESAEFDSALVLGAVALGMVEEEFGIDDTTTSKVLYKIGTYYAYSGDFQEAESRFARALTIGEKNFGPDHPNIARYLNALGLIYSYQAKYEEAEPIYRRSLDIKRKTLGPDHPDVANSLENLALLHEAQDEYVDAESCHLQALDIRRQNLGENHEEVAKSHNALGDVCRLLGRYEESEDHFLRAKAILEAVYGSEHVEIAYCHTNIANLHNERGRYDKAEPEYKQALAIMENSLGAEHPHVATALGNMALNYSEMGDYVNAEPLYQRAVDIQEATLGESHPDLAHSYNALASLYQRFGKYTEAESFYSRALKIREEVLGVDHYDVASTLTDLGLLLLDQRRYTEVERYFLRALEIVGKSRGREHPSFANGLENIARLYIAQGQYSEADSLLTMALPIAQAAYGSDHPRVSVMMQYQAETYDRCGRHDDSEALLEKARELLRSSLGEYHPKVARCTEALCNSYRLQERHDEAAASAESAYGLRWQHFSQNSPVLAERDALAYSTFLRQSADLFLSCSQYLRHEEREDARRTADIVLSSKGIVSESVVGRMRHLSESSDSLTLALEKSYRDVNHRISKMYVRMLEGSDDIQLRTDLDSMLNFSHELETAMARRGADPEHRIGFRRIAVDSIISMLPIRTALIEYLKFDYTEPGSDSTFPRYIVIAITGDDEPTIFDLGEASEVEAMIATYRTHMLQVSDAGVTPNAVVQMDYNDIGRALHDRIWKPVVGLAEDKDLILISPDGGLNLVSFAGLIDENGKYLIEKYPIHLLSAGRDILRLKESVEPANGLLAIGDPDYNATAVESKSVPESDGVDSSSDPWRSTSHGLRSGCESIAGLKVEPLPGTRSEVEGIAEVWKQSTDEEVRVYLGREASEERVKTEAEGRRIVHLATHGYFLKSECQPDIPRKGSDPSFAFVGENPLLLSGLLFAGANLHDADSNDTGAEDGVLTAYEVSAMNLNGTQLVVLSACETGLGEVKEGEGVYGLRRAFQLAGARTVISALWPVSDRLTAEMMGQLYQEAESSLAMRMRSMQLREIERLRSSGQSDHPFTWGAFVAVGDWR